MTEISHDSGWRGSQEVWLQAAYEALLETGVESVKILPLGKKLNLSRTSFYWFFKDREELLATLLTRWREKNTGNLVKQCEAYAESIVEAMFNVFDCWINPQLFDPRFEFAVRSWALQSEDISTEIENADRARLSALQNMFMRFGHAELDADVRARTTYLVQIGYVSMRTKEDISLRMKRIPHYVEVYTGIAPQQRDLDRFFSRHSFRAADLG
ncbi:TetR/AcrR family transcriptional regulator [Agrobacterium tumefaciens]|uniref:TetR/AcrR family transcriptional regulator n=1 Tax=Agrobacterium cavarae TaxID=2528239 RepID=UPI001294A29B|nr:TetR/AcrR family transcriptional regulator [Agrobacterium cavarae]MQB19182.1 TetR/AcrR family transcriptional regulator [Agrobacterium tumefaciens]